MNEPTNPLSERPAKNTQVKLLARDIAIYRHIWVLNPEEIAKLDAFFLLQATVGEVEDMLDKEHPFLDYLPYHGYRYEVVELNCKLHHLPLDRQLLLSFRRQLHSKLTIVLIQPPVGDRIKAAHIKKLGS